MGEHAHLTFLYIILSVHTHDSSSENFNRKLYEFGLIQSFQTYLSGALCYHHTYGNYMNHGSKANRNNNVVLV